MRRPSLLALLAPALLGLAACTPTQKDLLTGKAWTCAPSGETTMVLAFKGDGTLSGTVKLASAQTPPPPDAMALTLDVGGQWILKDEGALQFAFRSAKITEAKRGDAPVDPATLGFYKQMFEESPKTSGKITSITRRQLVFTDNDKATVITCTR